MRNPVAAFRAFAFVATDINRQALFTLPEVQAHAHRAAVAFVAAVQHRGVDARPQIDVAVSYQPDVLTRLQLAALHVDVGIGGVNVQVVARRQRAALALVRGLFLLGFRRLAAVGQVQPKQALRVLAFRLTELVTLIRLHAAEGRLHAVQRRQTASTRGAGVVRARHRRTYRTAYRARQRQRQPALLLLHRVGLHALVVCRQNVDFFGRQVDVFACQHVRAFYRQGIARIQRHVALRAAHRAAGAGDAVYYISHVKAVGAVANPDASGAGETRFFALTRRTRLRGVFRRAQRHVVARRQRNIVAGHNIAAHHVDIPPALQNHVLAAQDR